jgi:hypothetical protein
MLLNSILLIVVWLLSSINWCVLQKAIQLRAKKTIDDSINIHACEASFLEKRDQKLGSGLFTLLATWIGFAGSFSGIAAVRYLVWAICLATLYECTKCAAFISRAQFDKFCCACVKYTPTATGSNSVKILFENAEIAVSSKQIFIELYELDALQKSEEGIRFSSFTRLDAALTSPDCVEFSVPNSNDIIHKLKHQSKRVALSFGNNAKHVVLYLIVERADKTFTFCWR